MKKILQLIAILTASASIYADSVVVAPVTNAAGNFTVSQDCTVGGNLSVNGIFPVMPRSVSAKSFFVLEEFLGTNALSAGWQTYSTGNGTTAMTTTTANTEYGLILLSTTNLAGSTDRSGLRQWTTPFNIMIGGSRSHSFTMRLAVGTPADGTNTGFLLGGLGTTVTPASGNDTNSIEWKSTNGGNWTCVTTNASNTTSTDSLVPATPGTYRTLSFFVNDSASSVTFYNGTSLVATHTTNIPATTTAMGYRVLNTRLSATANNQTATVDFVGSGYSLGSSRWPTAIAP